MLKNLQVESIEIYILNRDIKQIEQKRKNLFEYMHEKVINSSSTAKCDVEHNIKYITCIS